MSGVIQGIYAGSGKQDDELLSLDGVPGTVLRAVGFKIVLSDSVGPS